MSSNGRTFLFGRKNLGSTPSDSAMQKKAKKDLMENRIKRAKKELEKVSHDFIRHRDSTDKNYIGGYCIDCGTRAEGQYFQAGHFEASGSCGAILRYHPHNIHGQSAGCNMWANQERVKINYTLAMIDRYGREYVNSIRALKHKTIKADIVFYETMISLYKEGDEEKIVEYLESLT